MSMNAQSQLVDLRSLGYTATEQALLLQRLVVRTVLGPWVVVGAATAGSSERWEALARVVGEELPAHAVISDHTAAWVWVGGPAPERVEYRVPRMHRESVLAQLPCWGRDGVPPDSCVVRRGRLAVTDPLRTAVDLMADAARLARADAVTLHRLIEPWGGLHRALPPERTLEGLSPRRRGLAGRVWRELPQAFR